MRVECNYVYPYPCGTCGGDPDPKGECTCSIALVKSYQQARKYPARYWTPLRVDTLCNVEVPHVPFDKLSDKRTGESSAAVRERVEKARAIQRECFKDCALQTNSDMEPAEICQFCPLDETSTNLVKSAMRQMQLSARAYHRILKLARTIADLAGAADIQPPHIAETIQYRLRRVI